MSAAKTTLPAVTEAEWQDQVIELAELLGWRVMHVRPSKGRGDQWQTTTSITGWPDLFLYNPRLHRSIAAELKSEKGKATPEQLTVLNELSASGVATYLWRPSHFDQVQIVLEGKEIRP